MDFNTSNLSIKYVTINLKIKDIEEDIVKLINININDNEQINLDELKSLLNES